MKFLGVKHAKTNWKFEILYIFKNVVNVEYVTEKEGWRETVILFRIFCDMNILIAVFQYFLYTHCSYSLCFSQKFLELVNF